MDKQLGTGWWHRMRILLTQVNLVTGEEPSSPNSAPTAMPCRQRVGTVWFAKTHRWPGNNVRFLRYSEARTSALASSWL